jgi:sporulation protein YlmC with PRC-barrel domain
MRLFIAALSSSALLIAPAPAQEPGVTGTVPNAGAVMENMEGLGSARGGLPDAPVSDGDGGPQEMTNSAESAETPIGTAERATLSEDGMSSVGPFITIPSMGAWRVSDLEGMSIYGAQGENIGSIKDVLVSPKGEVRAVLIGVGGFLGIGQKDVAVSMEALQFGPGMTPDDIAAAAANNPPQDSAAGPDGMAMEGGAAGAGNPVMAPTDPTTTSSIASGGALGPDGQLAGADQNATTVTVGIDGMPDRIVLNVTREQLEAAPAFAGIQAVIPEQ